jgi:hypothetical protein
MAKAIAQPIMVMPKAKVSASTSKKAKAAPKAKATTKANNNVAQEAPGSSWWSWLNPGSNGAYQLGGKKAKP